MLGGLDPIILFNFSKIVSQDQRDSIAKIPIISDIVDKFDLPPIPLYISQELTGLVVASEDKNIDIETSVETNTDGSDPTVTQKGLNSSIRVNLLGRSDSVGLVILSALSDLIFKKVTSEEYSVTYLHGPIAIFEGRLNSFSINQTGDNDLIDISFELASGYTTTKPGRAITEVPATTTSGAVDATNLNLNLLPA